MDFSVLKKNGVVGDEFVSSALTQILSLDLDCPI